MPYYGDEIVEQVREASDIVEILSEYLPLKRKGRNWWACCPFHKEKTPSFSVSPDKQIYYCFGCHKGGNVISFLMEHEKLPFVEALQLLATKANIRLPQREFRKESKELERLYFAHEVAGNFFHENLKDSHKTLEYLRRRKISDETIQTFKLGYALDNWEALIKHAHTKSLSDVDLEKAGLVIRRDEGSHYDRFRDRLIFTIFNTALKSIAFGARTFKQDEQAKYINSPETPLYHKGRILYGLSHSRGEIRKAETAIVVEGYFDYLSLYQVGVKNVVASSGTAFTPEQATLLGRSAQTAILMFDSDSAGQKAAVRSVDYLFEAGVEVRVVALPKGEDPDSIVREGGREALEKQLSQAMSFVEYSLSTLPDKYENLSLGMKDRAIKRLTSLAAKLDDQIRRELFLQEISERYKIDLGALKSSVKPVTYKTPPKREEEKSNKLEEEFISLLLADTSLVEAAAEKITATDFIDQPLAEVYGLMITISQQGGAPDAATLIDALDSQALKETVARLAATEFGETDMQVAFNDYVNGFRKRAAKQRLEELRDLLTKAERDGDEDAVKYYLNEINTLNK